MTDPAHAQSDAEPRVGGRYELCEPIASGGMGRVYLARLLGSGGFRRIVAIKRMHRSLSRDPEMLAMFLDEARLVSRIQHPNVVPTLDVIEHDGEVSIVMEYVRGESLSQLLRARAAGGAPLPLSIACAIACGTLEGLDAAHEARSESGSPLCLVHRDVSPHNILVGVDGLARISDFGIAKARGRMHVTRDHGVKGKIHYIAPEQLLAGTEPVDRRADIYSAAAVLWEAITGRRFIEADGFQDAVLEILSDSRDSLDRVRPDVPAALATAMGRALARQPRDRFDTARDFATAIEAAVPLATRRELGQWVTEVAATALANRETILARIEGNTAPAEAPSSGTADRAPSSGQPAKGADGDPGCADGTATIVTGPPPMSTRDGGTSANGWIEASPPARGLRRRVGRIAGAAVFATLLLSGGWLATRSRRSVPVDPVDTSAPASPEAPASAPAPKPPAVVPTRPLASSAPPPASAPSGTAPRPIPARPSSSKTPVPKAIPAKPTARATSTTATVTRRGGGEDYIPPDP